MQLARSDKKPVRPYSYSQGENESPRLINDEPVEIERDVPETDNKPVEREERQDKPVSISMDNKPATDRQRGALSRLGTRSSGPSR